MRKFIDFLIRAFVFPFALIIIFGLFVSYKIKGKLWSWEYKIYRKTYFFSGGISNIFLEILLSIKQGKYKTKEAQEIDKNGYIIVKNFLSDSDVEQISKIVERESNIQKGLTRLDVPQSVLNNSEVLDRLFFNNELIEKIAIDYLGENCRMDLRAAWRSFTAKSANKSDLSKAAQMWHVDLDTVKWLKAFIYLTDVDANSGPHCFCQGTHKTLPLGIIRDGRYSDEMIKSLNIHSDILLAPKGTLILADTRGIHRGLPVLNGERKIIQLQYSASSFGQLISH